MTSFYVVGHTLLGDTWEEGRGDTGVMFLPPALTNPHPHCPHLQGCVPFQIVADCEGITAGVGGHLAVTTCLFRGWRRCGGAHANKGRPLGGAAKSADYDN